MSVTISVTGAAKKLSSVEREIVFDAVASIKGSPAKFRNGCAPGVDVLFAEYAIERFGAAEHYFMIPQWAPKYNAPPQPCEKGRDRPAMSRCNKLAVELGVRVYWHWCDPGIGKEATGLLRRDAILAVNCTHGLAFPRTSKEEKRSGTWYTIRQFRRLGRGIRIVPLDGSEPWTEKSTEQVADEVARRLAL